MNVNLKAAFFASQAVARDMVKRGQGSIVSISSIDATVTPPEQVHYTASKAGISAMTKCLAIEWGPLGIRVNAIAPGWVLTDMTREALEQDGEAVLQRLPAGRVADPEDIAKLAAFLVSERAEYIMGAVVDCNGGLGLML
jgi:NAD(P)-dependent dehydrogenase (short-subunit alcohol dehydrogenase family)